jgi:hypothetical protein
MEMNTKAALILAGGLVAAALINRGIYAPVSIRGIGPVLNFNRFTGKVGLAVPRPAVSDLVTSHKPDPTAEPTARLLRPEDFEPVSPEDVEPVTKPTAEPTARLLRPKALTRPLKASDFEPVSPEDVEPVTKPTAEPPDPLRDAKPLAPLGYTVIHPKGLVAVNPKTGRCITWIDGKWGHWFSLPEPTRT